MAFLIGNKILLNWLTFVGKRLKMCMHLSKVEVVYLSFHTQIGNIVFSIEKQE